MEKLIENVIEGIYACDGIPNEIINEMSAKLVFMELMNYFCMDEIDTHLKYLTLALLQGNITCN